MVSARETPMADQGMKIWAHLQRGIVYHGFPISSGPLNTFNDLISQKFNNNFYFLHPGTVLSIDKLGL